MSHAYAAIGWNRQKRIYDLTMISGIVIYLALFIGLGAIVHPDATIETLIIRGLGVCALLMLHVVLSIGPLCRLSPRFLPLLYNRRHLGVAMFLTALAHGVFSIIQFHGLGTLNPLLSVFAGNTRYSSLADFPFQPLGMFALIILFLMAATSHDFWLANLTAPVWKTLHMAVYVAYGLIVAHVLLGVLQSETNPVLAGALGAGVVVVLGLHLVAGRREKKIDEQRAESVAEGFVYVCGIDDIPEKRAKIASVNGERIAVFKHDGKLSALSNVCRHQNGPLGEGRIIDGCVTCPWHGYQYLPETGASPPPFKERVPVFDVKVVDKQVFVNPRPVKEGRENAGR